MCWIPYTVPLKLLPYAGLLAPYNYLLLAFIGSYLLLFLAHKNRGQEHGGRTRALCPAVLGLSVAVLPIQTACSPPLSAVPASSESCCKSHVIALENILGRKPLAIECRKVQWNDLSLPVWEGRAESLLPRTGAGSSSPALAWMSVHSCHHTEAQGGRVLGGSSCIPNVRCLQVPWNLQIQITVI